MSKKGQGTAGGTTERLRWERALMRHPRLALPRLRAGMKATDPARARAALLGAFFVLERWGRAAELQGELQAELQTLRREVERQRSLSEAAELSEALGRLHYQRGDYVQACQAWSETLDWAEDDSRPACLARIGLAHLCYALGDWARGGRVLDQAELHYARLAQDPYLRAKIALNRAASLRATQGPQAARVVLDEALAAAREAGHADYQAEAIWHQARCARDSGDAAQALRLADQALVSAQRCGYRWLHAQAALLLCELTSGETALGWAGQALSLAEALQSRHLQAAAHGRLADLMREQGELGPSWHHLQQRQRLESTLDQGQLPTQLEALARFDTDPHGADALLLSLAGQSWPLDDVAEFERQWRALLPRLVEALGLSGIDLQWERLSERQGERPGQRAAAPAAPDAARLELSLRLATKQIGRLLLWRPAGASWSRADSNRANRLASWLEGLLGRLEQSLQRAETQAAEHAELLGLDRLLAAQLDAWGRQLSQADAPLQLIAPPLVQQMAALAQYRRDAQDQQVCDFVLASELAQLQAVYAPLLQAQGCELRCEVAPGLSLKHPRAQCLRLLSELIALALARGARRLSLEAEPHGSDQLLRLRCCDGLATPRAGLELLQLQARRLGGTCQTRPWGLEISLPTQGLSAPVPAPARRGRKRDR
ncbi:hypothetical protein PFX98_14160 [Paucibacter sediminis]|uniref:Tetratricopeptide repeat protein n=1 Tax=Paucibacter sediminis TaxID=3019553 RepID=A0AA95ND93_9BURK|nr:hypothetical protein [Paucibacter sp. S2-9]WIT10079.1 hypothetical protein PFX98_14160 [Paucibacter sp. S2-9]